MRPRQSLASPDSKSQMSPDSTNPAPDARPGMQSSLDPEITEALTELAARLEEHGVSAKVYVHDGMMSAMAHRGGDTMATIDEALVDGTNLIEELAAEIAAERGLPEDWLSRLCSTAQARLCTTRAECRSCLISPVPLKPFPL